MNISLRANILLIITVLILPLFVALVLVFESFNKDVLFAQKEKVGISVLRPAFKVLTEASFCNNDAFLKSSIKELISQLNAHKEELLFNQEYLKSKSKENLKINEIEKSLGSINCSNSNTIISLINDLFAFVGDSSNLVLDPDLDTYYVMDMGTYAFPNVVNRIKQIQSEKNSRLANINILKEIDLSRLDGDLKTALSEDKNFNSGNKNLQRNSKDKTLIFIKNFDGDLDKLSDESFFKIKAHLLEAHDSLYESLDEMLEARTISVRNERNLFLAIISILLILGLIVDFYIYKKLMIKLTVLSSQMNNSSENLHSVVEEMVNAADSLSSASNEQAAAIQETSSSLEEISTMLNVGNENIAKTMTIAKSNFSSVDNGKTIIKKMVQSIESVAQSNNSISKEVESTNDELTKIIHIINELGSKTKVINDIVFQTKLLSFNASVEAARAGEQGKGFAVVAEEIGNLAQMSGKSAQEITAMLDHSLKSVNSIIENTKNKMSGIINDSQKAINESVSIAGHCQGVFDEFSISSQSISGMAFEISEASKDQASGVNEVNKAVAQLDQSTQAIASDAQGIVSISTNVNTQSTDIKNLAEKLRQVIEGN